uniref:Apple domain-containing protein n=1 Tax=Meloidogyne hapla TaxID=6305 RepID=A0A1I8B6H7_MELHA
MGIAVCYESQLTNEQLALNEFKLNELVMIKPAKGNNEDRICKYCIDSGECKEYENGKHRQWNVCFFMMLKLRNFSLC